MAEVPSGNGRSKPASHVVQISVQVATGAELSPALTAALDHLAQILESESTGEVQGYLYQDEDALSNSADRPLRYNLEYRRGQHRIALQGLQ